MRYSPKPARTFEHFEDASEAWTPTGPVARTPRPVLLAVDEDEETLRGVSRELHQRYGNDYRVVCERFPRSALRRLCDFEAAGEDVALVLADACLEKFGGDSVAETARNHAAYLAAIPASMRTWDDA